MGIYDKIKVTMPTIIRIENFYINPDHFVYAEQSEEKVFVQLTTREFLFVFTDDTHKGGYPAAINAKQFLEGILRQFDFKKIETINQQIS